MIRGLILDIDGILVGEKIGYNSPWPHPVVTEKIRAIHASGIPVTLCTGKPHYAVGKLIRDCQLDTPHITDGGAIIIDPITDTIIKKHMMDKDLARDLVRVYLEADMYVEVYTPETYIIQTSQYRESLTPVHTHVLQTEPARVDSLLADIENREVIKVMPIATDEEDKKQLLALFEPFRDRAILSMGLHPVANPHQFGLITKAGISKKQSAIDAVGALGLPFSDILGAGDSTSDWQFMELTGYAATLGNGSDGIKEHVHGKGDHGFVTDKTVDENGILEVFEHFGM